MLINYLQKFYFRISDILKSDDILHITYYIIY